MFLKTLTLKGFKSFADQTTLALEPGVTVVVGPNGSGKSNIVDAVAWVLGAQGPRTVRSNKMEDVIFAGTAQRPALGRAEVSLTIDNSSGIMPIGFTEVTITRTLFRNGDSEYAINGVGCRLLDVQELLSDTGVGRQQHVIVSQGQLDAVLNSRPEDRRSIIEEAAGVLKYRKRRERAQRRLDATEVNFVRLVDLLREIRRQLRPLERQAEAARRHEEMARELRAIRLHLAGRELVTLRGRAEGVARSRHDLRTVEGQVIARLSQLDTEVELSEAALAALGGAMAGLRRPVFEGAGGDGDDADPFAGVDLGELLARGEALFQRVRNLVARLDERRQGFEADRAALADRGLLASLRAEAAQVAAETEESEHEALALPPQLDDVARTERELADEREGFLSEWGAEVDVLPSGPSAAAVRSELVGARSGVERANRERDRIDSRLRTLRERDERVAADLERIESELHQLVGPDGARADDEASAAGERRVAAEAEATAAETAATDVADRLREAEGDLRAWEARVDALRTALDEARARAGAERLAGIDGVVGTLLDLVEVDNGWEAAFEAALGEALSAVVVSDIVSARVALERLHETNASGAVLPLGTRLGAAVGVGVGVGVGTAVREHVRALRDEVVPLLDALLANVVLVDGHWSSALDAGLAHPELVIVTRDGSRFGRSGWRAGAGSAGATGAALDEATRRFDEARRTAWDAAAEAAGTRERLLAARTQLNEARRTETALTVERDRRQNRAAGLTQTLEKARSEGIEVSKEIEGLVAHRAELSGLIDADAQRAEQLEVQLPALLEAEAELAMRQARRREASQRLDARAKAVAALRTDLEVRAAALDERRRFLALRASELAARIERQAEEDAAASTRRLELELSITQTARLSTLARARLSEIESGLADVRERRRLQNEAAREATTRLDSLRRDRVSAERHLTETRERLGRLDIEEAEVRLRLETLTEQIRREFDCEPDATVAVECPELPDGTTASARARDLDRDIRLLGPINPLALEEFRALEERHTLIEGQLEDVKAARRELQKVIKAIDDEIISVFSAAFADVSANFESLFQGLFPGGHGRIRLTDPDNLLDCGVEVEARPSGKNVKKLSLLSGGERALVALAFLFAVFRSRPSPFYLLDEVEAALDDVNLFRFLGLLDEFRREAQLVVVSHQKRTMEAADCLYGVTMQPGGSSKVVSEKIAAKA